MSNQRKEFEIIYLILETVFDNPKSQNDVILHANLNTKTTHYYLKKLLDLEYIKHKKKLSRNAIEITTKGKYFFLNIKEYATHGKL